jgi:AcrR family transcriptional regulator
MSRRSLHEPRVQTLRSRHKEVTATAIMMAAEEVFADQGLHAAHVGDIAAKAGVAVGTLYNHFEDRDALLAGLLDARKAELLERLDQALAEDAKAPFEAQLRSFLQAYFEYYRAHRRFLSIAIQGELGKYSSTYPCSAAKPAEMVNQFHIRMSKLAKRGIQQKVLSQALADLYPSLLFGLIRALLVRDFYFGKDPTPADVDRMASFFLRGGAA